MEIRTVSRYAIMAPLPGDHTPVERCRFNYHPHPRAIAMATQHLSDWQLVHLKIPAHTVHSLPQSPTPSVPQSLTPSSPAGSPRHSAEGATPGFALI